MFLRKVLFDLENIPETSSTALSAFQFCLPDGLLAWQLPIQMRAHLPANLPGCSVSP